jgi:phosphoribosylamine--glycine ligase
MSAKGYPGSYARNLPISGISAAEKPGVKVFHAGTRLAEGQILSSRGRVLNVTALGETLLEARQNAYAAVQRIHMPDAHYRTDIGEKGLTPRGKF